MDEEETMDLDTMAAEAGTTPEEFNAFLHERVAYEDRIGVHDVLDCDLCKKETHG